MTPPLLKWIFGGGDDGYGEDGDTGVDNPHHESYHAYEVELDEAQQQIEDYEAGIDYEEP